MYHITAALVFIAIGLVTGFILGLLYVAYKLNMGDIEVFETALKMKQWVNRRMKHDT